MLDNPNPTIFNHAASTSSKPWSGMLDAESIYEVIKTIKDPEHPYSLEQLNVVSPELIQVSPNLKALHIRFTPTVPHCSLSTLIGLSIRVKLQQHIPKIMKVKITVTEGTHQQEEEINKQLNDKERVSAALENPYLMEVITSNIGDLPGI